MHHCSFKFCAVTRKLGQHPVETSFWEHIGHCSKLTIVLEKARIFLLRFGLKWIPFLGLFVTGESMKLKYWFIDLYHA